MHPASVKHKLRVCLQVSQSQVETWQFLAQEQETELMGITSKSHCR